jgi:hypothetical protein
MGRTPLGANLKLPADGADGERPCNGSTTEKMPDAAAVANNEGYDL